jgi:hypothetical protein
MSIERMKILIISVVIFTAVLILLPPGCKNSTGPDDTTGKDKTGNTDSTINVITKFIDNDYIELDKIYRISKFRSGIGHDYSDEFESCRSMKHYFQPKSGINWEEVKIFSPVDGVVSSLLEEWAGTQIRIQPAKYPDCLITIFHVKLSSVLKPGDSVKAGKQLGTHIGDQTMSDIAVRMNYKVKDEKDSTKYITKWKLISYFDIITDKLWENYKAHGLNSRNVMQITKEARDSDPLNCSGETFATTGTLENWVELK